jgi:hypothetical protein
MATINKYHKRATRERPPPPPPSNPRPGYQPPRSFSPYISPAPLGALTRLDPIAKLGICVAVVVLLAIVLS